MKRLFFILFFILILSGIVLSITTDTTIEKGAKYETTENNITYVINSTLTSIHTNKVNETCLTINYTTYCNESTTQKTIVLFTPVQNPSVNVELISPADNLDTDLSVFNFTANFTSTVEELQNSTFFLWNESELINQTTVDITGLQNNTKTEYNLTSFGTYYWNYKACTNSTCNTSIDNHTLLFGLEEDKDTGGSMSKPLCNISIEPDRLVYGQPGKKNIKFINNEDYDITFTVGLRNKYYGVPSIVDQIDISEDKLKLNKSSETQYTIQLEDGKQGFAEIILRSQTCRDKTIIVEYSKELKINFSEQLTFTEVKEFFKQKMIGIVAPLYHWLDNLTGFSVGYYVILISMIVGFFLSRSFNSKKTWPVYILLFTFLIFGSLIFWFSFIQPIELPDIVTSTISLMVGWLKTYINMLIQALPFMELTISTFFILLAGIISFYISDKWEGTDRVVMGGFYTFLLMSTFFWLFF